MEDSSKCADLSNLLNAFVFDFDHINKLHHFLFNTLLTTAMALEEMRAKWKLEADEVACLTKRLAESQRTVCELKQKEHLVRKIVDAEKIITKKAIKDKDRLKAQFSALKEIVNDERYMCSIDEEIRTRIFSFNIDPIYDYDTNSGTVTEMDTTEESMLDLSSSRDGENDFCNNISGDEGIVSKRKRKLADENSQAEAIKVNTEREITAVKTASGVWTSESYKHSPELNIPPSSDSTMSIDTIGTDLPPLKIINVGQHQFTEKIITKRETCSACNKKIKCSRAAYKCKICKTVCHNSCVDNVLLPCKMKWLTKILTPKQSTSLTIVNNKKF